MFSLAVSRMILFTEEVAVVNDRGKIFAYLIPPGTRAGLHTREEHAAIIEDGREFVTNEAQG